MGLAERRRVSLASARHLVTTGRNLQWNERELDSVFVAHLLNALEDMCLRHERAQRRRRFHRLHRALTVAGWYRSRS